MPQHESAKKSVRQDKRRTIVNRKRKGFLKSNIKKVILAIEEKDTDKARQAYSASVSLIDKMAAKGLVHKNNAARKKSSLCRKIAALS